ncbi:hypothetical protein BDA96_08G134200 [Sorghum bicolor]|uniref:PRA1 family protein n=1 Tax=Sorghum bicolor TaxID=4558 RepID=A0A921U870_SORBI|nr:hypothetical protein BDA96_08G134200 [Sorghum bicolor]
MVHKRSIHDQSMAKLQLASVWTPSRSGMNQALRPLVAAALRKLRHSLPHLLASAHHYERRNPAACSGSVATSRLCRNLGYFRVNYATVVAFSLTALFLAHLFSLLVLLGILGTWCFLYVFRDCDQPVVLFGHTFTDREMEHEPNMLAGLAQRVLPAVTFSEDCMP